jgi:hypothetical protein
MLKSKLFDGHGTNQQHQWTTPLEQDLAAVLNFRDILLSLRETGVRPECFLRRNENPYRRREGESSSSKKRKKRKTSSAALIAAGKS